MHSRNRQGGFTLIESLVTVVILAFGLVGLVTMQAKIQVAQTESYQRAQAILLLQDMSNRISANRVAAAQYVVSAPLGTGDSQPASCAGLTGVQLDLCEWSQELKGAGEKQSANSVGAMIGARGCVDQVSSSPPIYRVTVAWQGLSNLKAPNVACGQNLYGSDAMRRAIYGLVTVPNLKS